MIIAQPSRIFAPKFNYNVMKKKSLISIAASLALLWVPFRNVAQSPVVVAPATITTEDVFNLLYPTADPHTFLRLDTAYGKIWQIHLATDSTDTDSMVAINLMNLNGKNDPSMNAGTYALYPAGDGTFLLLDTILGRVWRVGYGDKAHRKIKRIR